MSPEHDAIGKFSEENVDYLASWVISQFGQKGIAFSQAKIDELRDKLHAYDAADVLQNPVTWYTSGTAERAYIYGNRLELTLAGRLDAFATIGWDSVGFIEPKIYDIEGQAERMFAGEKSITECGIGLRVEVLTTNLYGNTTNIPHLLNSKYPYDKPLQQEISRRMKILAERCSNPDTLKAAKHLIAQKIANITEQDWAVEATKLTLKKVGRQPKGSPATHFVLEYRDKHTNHSGRQVDVVFEFRININNTSIAHVSEDVARFKKDFDTQQKRGDKAHKQTNLLRMNSLGKNAFALLDDAEVEVLMVETEIRKRVGETAVLIKLRNMEVEVSLYFHGGSISKNKAEIGRPISQIMADSLVGRPLRQVIDHPMLDPDLIISKAKVDDYSTALTFTAPKSYQREI